MKVFAIEKHGKYLQWSAKGTVWGALETARTTTDEKEAKKLASDYDGFPYSFEKKEP